MNPIPAIIDEFTIQKTLNEPVKKSPKDKVFEIPTLRSRRIKRDENIFRKNIFKEQ